MQAIGANPVPEVTEKQGVYTRRHYQPMAGGYEFDYYSLDGYGHEYKNTDKFNESNVIWNFLSRYTLDTPPAGATGIKNTVKKNGSPKVVSAVNAAGMRVNPDAKGLVLLCMDDGSVMKITK